MIIIPLLLPGLIVAAMRCMLRSLSEQRNVFVETVADLDEFRRLAREDGWTLDELFTKLHDNGISSVSISEDTLASLELEGKITVLSTKEIRKLSLEESFDMKLPVGTSALAGLWVHSEDDKLLDRIYQNLSWKLPDKSLIRIHRNLLLINKSGQGFMERVGLGYSEEYFKAAEKANLGIVVRMFNYPGLTSESASKMINAIPSPASVSALLFAEEEMLGARGDLQGIIKQFENRSYRIGWIEFDIQDGIHQYLNGLSKNRPFVRVHSITRKEMDLVYTKNRAIARWVRAVKDRSLKMLYFRCFFQDDKKYISNLTNFNLKYVKDTVDELYKAGFQIARTDEERLNDPRHIVGRLIPAEILAVGLALIMGVAVLLKLSFMPAMGGVGALLFAFIAVALYFISCDSFIHVAGIAGAVAYSCIGFLCARYAIENNRDGYLSNAIKFVLCLVGPSIVGGILIAGLHSNIEYMLRFEQFRGVKLAFILPLIFTFVWALKKNGRNVFTILQKPVNFVGALIVVGVGLSLVLYVMRSGNSVLLKPTAIEDAFRTFLETTLVARPRNKEFLVGYPSAMLFVMLLMRKEVVLLPLLALFIQMGQVSVVNTMCHFHTPVKMSLLRIANGLWLGIVIGLVLVAIWRFVQLLLVLGRGKQRRVFLLGYFGFGNVGDELLCETYASKLAPRLEIYRISILAGRRKSDTSLTNVNWIPRSDLTAVLEELMKCEAVVIPGGGVFQSTTSVLSPLYYTSMIWLARMFKAKIILPAQGLGPWNQKGFLAGKIHYWLGCELEKADYITLRDENSTEMYKDITSSDSDVEVTNDLVFLNDGLKGKEVTKRKEFLKIYVILRSSIKGTNQIIKDLMSLAEENSNIELVPVAFQHNEDSLAWRNAGWSGDIKLVEGSTDCVNNAFADADLVISMRLHGCIIATKLGIPWIGIAYDPKVNAFAESCKLGKFCVAPSEANAEFFEKCINKLAYEYVSFSQRLFKQSAKFHEQSVNDFEASVRTITRSIAVVLLLLASSTAVMAKDMLPEWMKNIKVEKTEPSAKHFKGPIDPETGQEVQLESGMAKRFRPDFKKIREKSIKTVVEKDGHSVMEEKASSERSVASPSAEIASETESLTATSSPVIDYDREPTEEELMERNTYRPGRIKSYYLECKEQERRQKEEAEQEYLKEDSK